MDQLLWTIVIGFVVGVLAKFFYPGSGPQGFVITTLLGIGGSMLARFLGQALGIYTASDVAGIFASMLGAMLLLAIHHLLRKD
jgi:uncharacterized membrane protein YeaQ/YmgE (transglycosylase-associated protein family)